MNDLDEGFSNPDIYNDPERVSNLKIEYSQLETKLNESMEKWTELNTKLDETLSEISIHQT